MINAKKIYKNIRPEFIKNKNGKTLEVCIDIKTYKSVMAACKEWERIQKTEKIRWVQVSRESTGTKK